MEKHVKVVLGADTAGFNTAMGGAMASTAKFKLGVIAASAAVVALGVAITTKAVKAAANFELGMAKVKAISSATAEEFKTLTGKAKELGLVTAQTMTDIAAGMEAFARAGFDAAQIINAMAGAVALAESQVMDLGRAVEITAGTLKGMRLAASESERVANALAAAASSSATTVETLAESMKYLAPVAADLKVPLEEALVIVGKLGDANLKGGRATRAFSTALKRLAAPTDEMIAVMDGLVNEFFDAHGEFIGLIGVIGILEKAFVGLTDKQKTAALTAIFGAESSSHFSILIAEGAEALEKYRDELTDTTTAFDQQAAMIDTLIGQWKILTGSIELLLVTLGTPSLDTLKGFTKAIIDVVNAISQWKEATQAAADEIKGAGDEAEGAEKKIVSLDDRILELTGGLVNLRGVVYGVMNAIKVIWDVTAGFIIAMIKEFTNRLVMVIKLLQGDWKGAWEAAMKQLGAWRDYFTTIFDDLGIAFKDWIDSIKGWWSGMWEGLKSDLRSFVNFFIGQFNWIITQLNRLPFVDMEEMALLTKPPAEPTGALPWEITGGLGLGLTGIDRVIPKLVLFGDTTEEIDNVVTRLTSHFVTLEQALQNLTPTAIAMAPLKAAEMLKDLAKKDFVAAAIHTQELIRSIEEEIAAMAFFGQDTTEATKRLNEFKKAMGITTETVTELNSLWSPLRSVLGKLPGLMGSVATGLVDLAQGIVTGNIGGIITSIFNMITAWIQDEVKKLEARLDELREILSFYVSSFKQIGSMLSGAVSGLLGPLGNVLAGTIQLLTSSIEMLRLGGIDLLRVGMTSLIGFVSTLIGTFSDLIQRSVAYGALQQESESIWKALGNVLGQFLWPLVEAIKYLKEWLGIQASVNEQMTEIGVPAAWKRERRAYEAAAPGRIVTTGVEVPSWAQVLGQKLGETIRNVLEGFGISSWTELLAGARDWAVRFYDWLIGNLPTWINQAVTFLGQVRNAIMAVYNWAVSNLGDMGDLGSVWDNFANVLGSLPTWPEVQSEIDQVISSIDSLKDTMKWVIAVAAGVIVGGIGGALTPLTFGLSAAGAAAGALIGAGLGATIAGQFDKGGVIPGPPGSRQIVAALGGEEIRTRAQQGQTIINEIRVFIGDREVGDVFVETVQRRGKSATGHRSTAAALTRRY